MKPSTRDRIAALLATALDLARRKGWHSLTHEAVAAAAGVSPSLVKVRLGTIATMRRAVMRAALAAECVPVVAQGLAAKDRTARQAHGALRAACGDWVEGA